MRIIETKTFSKWRAIIAAKIRRLAKNLSCDVKTVGTGIKELRIHCGAGYRVYFSEQDNTLLILLCGGNKSSQQRDIDKAQQLLKEWS